MKGESRGDFSRDTFDPSKNFLRVLMQQGRVSLDADWNEQVDILLHYIQTLANDIIGPHAGPEKRLGFKIIPNADSFNIGYGRYYVDGILCENENKVFCGVPEPEAMDLGPVYDNQQDYPITKIDISLPRLEELELPILVYLDVWERHISYVEDDDIREKALEGPDTASRSKLVWQVKVLDNSDPKKWRNIIVLKDLIETECEGIRRLWTDVVEQKLQPHHRGCLMAQANKSVDETDPCITSPKALYRGEENQLYRVEIHRTGMALYKDATGNIANASTGATFKWSRDNGTVAFPIISKNGFDVFLENLGRDDRLSLKVDDWVEIIDDDYTLLALSRPSPSPEVIRPLAQVEKVDLTEMKVTLRKPKLNTSADRILKITYKKDSANHPLLRRWDHKEGDPAEGDKPDLANDGALSVEEGRWLDLEDGIQVQFKKNSADEYCTGDYWVIPARTGLGDVEWPKGANKNPIALPPQGVDHHYAPLAILTENDKYDCRCEIRTTCNLPSTPEVVQKSPQ